SISAPRVKKCPQCGRRSFARLISASAFHLKGGGWYATDFKNKPKPGEEKGGKKEDAQKEKSGNDKTGTEKAEKSEKPDSAKTSDAKKPDGGGKKSPEKPPARK
ncbi:MAG: FmdB family zinc ribbon protein, partial [Gammaproteobacteria bacterium]